MKTWKSLTLCLAALICLVFFTAPKAEAATSVYYYEVNDGEATITDVDTSIRGNITIPSTLGGYPVTSIGYAAFYYCTSLTNITLPDRVSYIGDFAFCRCTGLQNVTLGKRVKNIDGYAFYECSSLQSINIPNTVTRIGYNAFSGCNSLKDVYITDPSAWCKIESDSIMNTPAYYMEHLHILDDNGNAVTEIVLDDSVTEIPSYAFLGCTSLTSVTIPDSVTTIGNKAFKNCAGLTDITFPDSVTKVGNSAFSGCKSLKTVYYSGTQTQWQKITVESYNSRLTDANVQYDHIHDYSLFPTETVAPTCTDSGFTVLVKNCELS